LSKELEALKRLVSEVNNYKLSGSGDNNWLGFQDVLKDVNTIEKVLTPPTEEEVCDALSEYFGNDMKHCEEVIFRQNKFIIVFESGGYSNVIDFTRQLLEEAPHLITMIGRFYEGLSDVNE